MDLKNPIFKKNDKYKFLSFHNSRSTSFDLYKLENSKIKK